MVIASAIEKLSHRLIGIRQHERPAAGYCADLGDWKKARELFEKAHALNPKSPGVLINLGNVCVEMKDFAGARKCFEEAIKLDPNGEFAQEAKKAPMARKSAAQTVALGIESFPAAIGRSRFPA